MRLKLSACKLASQLIWLNYAVYTGLFIALGNNPWMGDLGFAIFGLGIVWISREAITSCTGHPDGTAHSEGLKGIPIKWL